MTETGKSFLFRTKGYPPQYIFRYLRSHLMVFFGMHRDSNILFNLINILLFLECS